MQTMLERREAVVARMLAEVPYVGWLGVTVDRRGDELTAALPFAERLIGNPVLPALHGGVTAAFLEISAVVQLVWTAMGDETRAPAELPDALPRLPKTIDFTIDYLRSGIARDAYARARVVRFGRRYASVEVEAWQDSRDRPFAQATGHFLMPRDPG